MLLFAAGPAIILHMATKAVELQGNNFNFRDNEQIKAWREGNFQKLN